jgi:hypothetical protein
MEIHHHRGACTMDRKALALALAGAVATNLAAAASTASIQVTNQTPLMLYTIDGSAPPVLATQGPNPQGSFAVQAGYAVGFEFDYAISVSDQGLPVGFDQPPTGRFYGPGQIFVYSPNNSLPSRMSLDFQGTGYREIGFANLFTSTFSCVRTCAPDLVFQNFQLVLSTHPDDQAESFAASGHAVVWSGVSASSSVGGGVVEVPHLVQDSVAVSAAVQPVPEPTSALLVLAGLGALRVWGKRSGRSERRAPASPPVAAAARADP